MHPLAKIVLVAVIGLFGILFPWLMFAFTERSLCLIGVLFSPAIAYYCNRAMDQLIKDAEK